MRASSFAQPSPSPADALGIAAATCFDHHEAGSLTRARGSDPSHESDTFSRDALDRLTRALGALHAHPRIRMVSQNS